MYAKAMPSFSRGVGPRIFITLVVLFSWLLALDKTSDDPYFFFFFKKAEFFRHEIRMR